MDPRIDLVPSAGRTQRRPAGPGAGETHSIASELLYVTPRQAELWREVFLKYSPAHANPEFQRIYRDAFARVAASWPPGRVHLLGLGCGTGSKEAELCRQLRAAGHEVEFSALDISGELVRESIRHVTAAGGVHRRSRVGALHDGELARWVEEHAVRPVLATFFGLVPNLTSAVVANIFLAVLKPGDLLLVSANLAPVASDDPAEIPAALEIILPQYDNAETRAWLWEAVRELRLDTRVGPPAFWCEVFPGMASIIAECAWIDEPARAALRVFETFRYTSAQFEAVMQSYGLQLERLGVTACREEGIWSVRVVS